MTTQPRKTSNDIEILQPTTAATVQVGRDGLVFVEVNLIDPQVDKVVAEIFDIGTPSPADPQNAVELSVQAGGKYTGHLPVVTAPTSAPAAPNNYVKAWPYIDDEVGDPAESEFKAWTAATVDLEVTAKSCIWFTWAPPDYRVDEHDEEGETYRPKTLIVPSNATQAVVTVTSPDTVKWRHDPANSAASGPEGLSGNQKPMQKPQLYKTAALKSENIIGTTPLPLNMLVGLWDWGSDVETTEIPIGQSDTINWGGGDRPHNLQLGFHDGFEWSNNSGEMDVQVVWS